MFLKSIFTKKQRLTMSSPESATSSAGKQVMPCRSPHPAENNFSSEELLFRRVLMQDFDESGHPYPLSFTVPVSANRSRYSKAVCVLCRQLCDIPQPTANYRPAEISVSSLLVPSIALNHTPSDRNCSHCDITPEVNDKKSRKRLRQYLSDHFKRVMQPTPCEHLVPKD